MFARMLCIASVLIAYPNATYSQWPSDPAQNLRIADTTGEQILPKVAVTSDGGCYISWFDHRGSNYGVYMQRLNAQGEKQWPMNGLLISDYPQNSSLVDYDLAVDDSNNAILVFTDVRAGGAISPVAYRMSPQGSFLWGPDGIPLATSTATYQPNPKVVATSDDGFVFAWVYGTTPNQVALQRLSAAGIKQWGTDPVLLSGGPNENLTYPSLARSDNGSVILLMSGYTGSFLNPGNYRLYSQKYSTSGMPVWGSNPETVYSLGNVTGFFVPKIFSDGRNGALYVWQDDRNSTNRQASYVQHYDSSGTRLFPENGTACSTNSLNNHFDAWAAYSPSSDETYVVWKETNDLQSQFGIYGQRISASGDRLWNDNGREFKPLDTNSSINQVCFVRDTLVAVFFNEGLFGSANNVMRGFGTGPSGEIVWGGNIITPGSQLNEKSKIVGAMTVQEVSLLMWSDKRLDGGGIYAQNVNGDGSFGLLTGVTHEQGGVQDKFLLAQNYPNPFNPSTMIRFRIPSSSAGDRTVRFTRLRVYDVLGREVATLVNGDLNAGTYAIEFNGAGLSSGLYYYSLESAGYVSVKKMMLVR